MVAWPRGLTRLYGPPRPCSTALRVHAARSRVSMNWMPESWGPGASTGPPRAMRFSHHGSRPTFSQGPRISPARTSSARSPKAATAASSPPRLASGYSTSPASGEPSTSAPLSSSPGAQGCR